MRIELYSKVNIIYENDRVYDSNPHYISLIKHVTNPNLIKKLKNSFYYFTYLDDLNRETYNCFYIDLNNNANIVKFKDNYYMYDAISLYYNRFDNLDDFISMIRLIENKEVIVDILNGINDKHYLAIQIPSSIKINTINFQKIYYKNQLKFYIPYSNTVYDIFDKLKNEFSYVIKDEEIYLPTENSNKEEIDKLLNTLKNIIPNIKLIIYYIGTDLYHNTIKLIEVIKFSNYLSIEFNFDSSLDNYFKKHYKNLINIHALYKLINKI